MPLQHRVVGMSDASSNAASGKAKAPKKNLASMQELQAPAGKRTVQASLVALSRFMCYLSRGQLGVLLPLLAVELQMTSEQRGRLMSRYAMGYLTTQVLGGIAADRLGGYCILTPAMFLSGIICLAIPHLAAHGHLGAALLFLGIVQGTVFPAGSVVSAAWLLPSERAWASSISAIGAAVGTFLVNASAPLLSQMFGWQAVFFATGSLCLIFVFVFLNIGISTPSAEVVEGEELKALDSCGLLDACGEKKAMLPPPSFFSEACIWTLFFAHFAQNWQQSFAEWMPMLYHSGLQTAPEVAGGHLGVVALLELPARALTKDLPTYFMSNGLSLLDCRKRMSVWGFVFHIAFLGCLLALLIMKHVGRQIGVMAFTSVLCIGKVSQSMHAGGYFANYYDLTRRYAGALTGVGNTLATLAGLTFPMVASQHVDTDLGWAYLCVLVICLNLLAIVAISRSLSVTCLDNSISATAVSKHG